MDPATLTAVVSTVTAAASAGTSAWLAPPGPDPCRKG